MSRNQMDRTEDGACLKIFLVKVLLKVRMWQTKMAMLIIMTIFLLHMGFWTMTGPAFFVGEENDSDFEGF